MKFFKQTQIEEYSAIADTNLQRALESARNRRTSTRWAQNRLQRSAGRYLLAVNHRSRVIWGKAISEQLAKFFCKNEGGVEHGEPVYLVTLVDVGCVTATADATPDIERFKAYLRYGLKGHSYFGAIEPAYYANVQNGISANVNARKNIFWHIHVLLWGISNQECRKLIKQLNMSGKYRPIIDRLRGAHRKVVKAGDLAAVTGYVFKPPGLAYRVWKTTWREYDQLAERLRQRTSPLRPGERLNLFCSMSDLYLDQLALAGGEGVKLFAAARKQALQASGYAKLVAEERGRKCRSSSMF